MNNELLLLIKKHTDTLIEQTKTNNSLIQKIISLTKTIHFQ